MPEYYMGQELIQGELPPNSPKPSQTPPDGVIMTDITADGWSRRYIYVAMAGAQPEEILISETPPSDRVPAGIIMPEGAILPEGAVFSGIPSEGRSSSVMGGRSPVAAPAMRAPISIQQAPMSVPTISIQKAAPQAPQASSLLAKPAPMLGSSMSMPFIQKKEQQEAPSNIPLSNSMEALNPTISAPIVEATRMAAPMERSPMAMGTAPRSLPLMTSDARKPDLYPIHNPVVQNAPMGAGVGPLGGPSAFVQNQIPLRLGQQAAPGAPAPEEPVLKKCPGALEMPDGRKIEPEDPVSLQDLCEIVPFLVESLTNLQAKGLAPGQKVPVVGQKQGGVAAVPTSASFGPAGQGGGPFGTSGGMSFGGGGGGPGPAGPQGRAGAPGAGIVTEPPVVKTDGDFAAGPGAFVVVPGTNLVFALVASGIADFKLTVTAGSTAGLSGLSQSGQIGLRIDGVDYPLSTRLIHTFVGGVGEFLLGQNSVFSLALGPGSHSVDVVIRGLLPGEFGGAGLGIPFGVAATPEVPLVLSVSHS